MRRQASRLRCLVLTAVAMCAAAAGSSPAYGQDRAPAGARLLDVPYLPQTEALCGGASAAMVMRYWGARGTQADTFAHLVDRSAGGIRTDALVAAIEQRGWTALAGPTEAVRVREHLGRGRPVIALIEDRPGRFHYVVVVGWMDGKVIVHDPARAPLRASDEAAFERVWAKSDRWALVALPPRNPAWTGSMPMAAEGGSSSGPCAGSVESAVRLAQSNDADGARRTLEAAAVRCPADAAPWRELAGLDALAKDWVAAASHSSQAIARDPRDAHAWRILATARYVRREDADALDAWNQIGEPRVDIVDVRGLERTRYQVIGRAIGLDPDDVVTAEGLRLAERRARDVPAISAARVAFHPLENGRAQVDAAVAERTLAPLHPLSLANIGLGAAIRGEISASLASVTGGGELLTGTWRWNRHRPRVALIFAAPAPAALGGGVWRVELSRETQTFGAPAFVETRAHAGFAWGTWVTSRIRIEGGLASDRWALQRNTAAISGAIQVWPVDDRLSLDVTGAGWLGGPGGFGTASVAGLWKSKTIADGVVWLARGGAQGASREAPALLWPGADTGRAYDVLLRAHPLLHDGIITGGVFGRRIVFGGAEWRRWAAPIRVGVRLAPAIFADLAEASRGLPTTDMRLHADVGAGLRVAAGGLGALRIDLGLGVRDGRMALSVGWDK